MIIEEQKQEKKYKRKGHRKEVLFKDDEWEIVKDNLSEQLARLNEQLSAASKEVRKYKVLIDIYDKMTTKLNI